MEAWFIVIFTLCIAVFLRSIVTLFYPRNKSLPPGPPSFPIIGNLLWLTHSISDIESIIRRLKSRYGPLITLKIGNRPMVFVANHSLAHQALVQNGAVFSDRPPPSLTNGVRKVINSSPYGATWRLLRRNLTQEILHPTRVRAYSASRRWVLSILIDRLRLTAETDSSVRLIDHFQYAMFCLLVFMCFGDKLHENQIKEIESVQRKLLLGFRRFNILNLWPKKLGKILFRKRWEELLQLRQEQNKVLIPLIRARILSKQMKGVEQENDEIVAYVDTFVDLQLPEEENRKLEEEDMVSLCSEFLVAGTDTTSTALQWIMANLVKYPELQDKLYKEIISVVGEKGVVEEEDLDKLGYLKAVVLEGLRRHPPGHFVLPHKAKHDVEFNGCLIPKNAFVNFMVAELGLDPEVWEDPMSFKPERFLGEQFDVTCSREIKMMPFGAGRRICPGYSLALLHLEYFVANLVCNFKWTVLDDDDGVDLSETQEFTIVMKNPLRARICARI